MRIRKNCMRMALNIKQRYNKVIEPTINGGQPTLQVKNRELLNINEDTIKL